MGTDLDTPSRQESTPLTEHPLPADNLLRLAAFLRRLAVLGKKNGFGVAHELTATGAVVFEQYQPDKPVEAILKNNQ